MANRQTSEWTKTSEQAFGKSGKIGDDGEIALLGKLRELGLEVDRNGEDKELQLKGWDLTLTDGNDVFGADVKTNLFGDRIVYVDKVKIWNSEALLWFHYDRKTGRFMWYLVDEMRSWLKETKLNPIATNGGLCYEVPQEVIESWKENG